jgi:hypothetical protein
MTWAGNLGTIPLRIAAFTPGVSGAVSMVLFAMIKLGVY